MWEEGLTKMVAFATMENGVFVETPDSILDVYELDNDKILEKVANEKGVTLYNTLGDLFASKEKGRKADMKAVREAVKNARRAEDKKENKTKSNSRV